MTGFSNSPRIIKGGLVLIDPDSASVRRVIALQYNPDTLTRTLQPQQMGEGVDQSEALRLKGPAVETLKLEVEIDAADQLEFPRSTSERGAVWRRAAARGTRGDGQPERRRYARQQGAGQCRDA